jgi:hypothetical protein
MIYSLILPAFVLLGGYAMSSFHENLARVNPTVRLAIDLRKKEVPGQPVPVEITTFKSSGKSTEKLYAEADRLLKNFHTGGWILGAFFGLVFGLSLLRLSVYRHYTGYSPNKGTCFSCARCIDYCPVLPGQFVDGKPVVNSHMLSSAAPNKNTP